jgi:hypothetical protein
MSHLTIRQWCRISKIVKLIPKNVKLHVKVSETAISELVKLP